MATPRSCSPVPPRGVRGRGSPRPPRGDDRPDRQEGVVTPGRECGGSARRARCRWRRGRTSPPAAGDARDRRGPPGPGRCSGCRRWIEVTARAETLQTIRRTFRLWRLEPDHEQPDGPDQEPLQRREASHRRDQVPLRSPRATAGSVGPTGTPQRPWGEVSRGTRTIANPRRSVNPALVQGRARTESRHRKVVEPRCPRADPPVMGHRRRGRWRGDQEQSAQIVLVHHIESDGVGQQAAPPDSGPGCGSRRVGPIGPRTPAFPTGTDR